MKAHLHFEPRGNIHHDWVGVTQVERELVPRGGRSVPHTDHVQGFGEARRCANDHVARQSPARASALSLMRAVRRYRPLFWIDSHVYMLEFGLIYLSIFRWLRCT